MDSTIFSINPLENYFYFVFLVTLALILGISLYRFMRNPHLRRIKPITVFDFDEPPISNRCSIVVGIAIALPLIINAYIDNWQHFYSINQESGQLYVHYLFPNRIIKISNIGGIQITTQYEVRRGASYRIKIVDSDRHEYSSQVMEASEMDENLAKLNDAIKPYRTKNIKHVK